MTTRRGATDAAGRSRAVALVVLAIAAGAGWWPVLGSGELWALPAVAVGVLVALGTIAARTAAAVLVAWVPAALLLAGVPVADLRPAGWGAGASSLTAGLDGLTVPARQPVADDPWPLAGALLVTGVAWIVAGLLARRRGRAAGVVALVLPALPLVWALALEHTADAAWPGAALLAAGVLWSSRGRLAALVPATAVVAAVTVVAGQALGPEEQWIPFVDVAGPKPQFTRLDTTQTYGPLEDRRTGAVMVRIEARQPALWRMQVLERFDGGRWAVRLRPRPDLPQPAAVPEDTAVRVQGLRDRLIPAPGRITAVTGTETDAVAGEARALEEDPRRGDVHQVASEVVRVSAAQLRDVQIPAPGLYADYTRIWGGSTIRRGGRPAIELVDRAAPRYDATDFMRVLRIAADLAEGAPSQLDLVRRVQRFLVGGDRYRYTTDVPEAGPRPLFDFLLRDRAGYCQQFAGAAALLLRMAGVPTRVVTGFATGEGPENGSFTVRDQDAHAWIEVYFPGFGWVPFNPTPPDAEAQVAEALDVFAPPAGTTGGDGGAPAALLLVPLAVAGAGAALRVRRRRRGDLPEPLPVGELLARLAPGPVGPATTLAGLRPRLEGIGPSVAALADEVERDRWSGAGAALERRPRLRVWRALRRDLGTARATVLVARHGARAPRGA